MNRNVASGFLLDVLITVTDGSVSAARVVTAGLRRTGA